MNKPSHRNTPPKAPSPVKKKPTGIHRRRASKEWEGEMQLLIYRPEELLSPAEILFRFTERAQQLIGDLPEADRPTGPAVTAALRQAVLEAFRTREEHIARMVETDLTASVPGQRATALRRGIRSSLVGLGVRVVDTPDEQELFVVVEGRGDAFEVLRPAYVDQATGKLILSGQLRRVPASQPAAAEDRDVKDAPREAQGEETE